MGLENLRSVFQEQLENNIDEYISNRPIDVNTTNLDYNTDSVISQTHGSTISMTTRGGRSNPILDSLLRGRVYDPIRFSQNFTNDNLFIGPEQPPFDVNAYTSELETFDPRATTPKEGTLYFNTTSNSMQVYGSSGFQNAGSSVNGTSSRQTYTATGGQTTFSVTYDAGFVDVYLNGVKLLAGTDFTATSGTAVVLASGATAGDIVDIVAYGTFSLSTHYTKTESDARFAPIDDPIAFAIALG